MAVDTGSGASVGVRRATVAGYEIVLSRLLRQSGVGVIGVPASVDLCRFLAGRVARGEISWATAKQYASAVRWGLRREGQRTDAFDAAWADVRLGIPRVRRRGRGVRRSRIDEDVIRVLRDLAEVRDGLSAAVAVALFHGAVVLGLRPCEWAAVRWADAQRTALVVRNAKAASLVLAHGPFAGRLWVRGNGAERCLRVTPEGVASGVSELVDHVVMMEAAMPWAGHRCVLYRAFRAVVTDAVAKGLLDARHRRLTIYSGRHQFAADGKRAMGVAAGEVAASMGHSAVRTAVSGYGRRLVGTGRAPMVQPDAESVRAVRSLKLRQARAPRKPVSAPPAPRM